MPENRPQGRKTNVTGQSTCAYRRGEGLNTGPVGSSGSNPHSSTSGSSRPGMSRATKAGGGGGLILIIVLVLYFLLGRGGSSGSLGDLTGGDTGSAGTSTEVTNPFSGLTGGGSSSSSGIGGYSDVSQSPYANLFASAGSSSTGSTAQAVNTTSVDTSVANGARDKYTTIRGNGQDEITIMVYMCGTDLESRSGMATKDLTEMTRATIGNNIHLLVYTGGCTKWNNNIVSSSRNQIYEVRSGGVKCLVSDDGTGAMTDPANLTRFIQWSA